jgi:hypothetical protein
MPWANGPLIVYHGCHDVSATSIRAGINTAHCRLRTDFGIGFYTTTSYRQAAFWANGQYRRARRKGTRAAHAVVLQFTLPRIPLSNRSSLVFIVENSNPDYWDFVTGNRTGPQPHYTIENVDGNYDVVYGPVSLWPQLLVIKDCDQISFHNQNVISALPTPGIRATGTASDPLLRP